MPEIPIMKRKRIPDAIGEESRRIQAEYKALVNRVQKLTPEQGAAIQKKISAEIDFDNLHLRDIGKWVTLLDRYLTEAGV